jgi:hypothetical protein
MISGLSHCEVPSRKRPSRSCASFWSAALGPPCGAEAAVSSRPSRISPKMRSSRSSPTRGSSPISSQVFYLLVYLIQRLPDACFQPCPSVVGEITGKPTRLFQEHAHVP